MKAQQCVICGTNRCVDANHLGGRKYIAWFTMPFCKEDHDRFHLFVRQSGTDLTYTDDPIERIRRALAAIKVAEWMLLEQLKNINQRKENK